MFNFRGVVKKILNLENVSKQDWQNVFADVHYIVSWQTQSCDSIITSLTEAITESAQESLLKILRCHDDTMLLKAYVVEWNKFHSLAEYLPHPFTPVEKSIVGQHRYIRLNKRSMNECLVRTLMLETWNISVFESVKKRLQECAMKHIQIERNGLVIESSLVIGYRESCVELSAISDKKIKIYGESFETPYIESAETYYRTKCHEFLHENGIRKYLAYAQTKITEEEDRALKYLDNRTEYRSVAKLVKACVKIFVIDFFDFIISEFPTLLHENNYEQLRLVYKLVNRVPDGISKLIEMLEKHIYLTGIEDLKSSAGKEDIVRDADKFVSKVLTIYHRYTDTVTKAFNSDTNFLTARDKSFQEIVNDVSIFHLEINVSTKSSIKRVESRCPELLASYCDMLLRKSPTNRRLTSEEIESRLKEVLLILKYVNSKDLFMRVYKTYLMRRLILETSADTELEIEVVERLRDVGMPGEQINKLGRMFQEIKISEDLTNEFREFVHNNGTAQQLAASLHNFSPDVIFIKIISSGTWLTNTNQRSSIALPIELEDYIPLIEDFYRGKHKGRTLNWQHHLSHGVITYNAPMGKLDLELTTYQLVVLYVWNNRCLSEKIELDTLITATGLQINELRKTLWSLCEHPKLDRQIIFYSTFESEIDSSQPQGLHYTSEKQFTPKTLFWLNENFTIMRLSKFHKRKRVNLIGRLQLIQDTEGDPDGLSGLVRLRQLRTEEAIMKIMKSRKCLHINDLYKELLEILRYQFIPSKRLVKEVNEWLLEKQYLRRSDQDMNIYIYVT